MFLSEISLLQKKGDVTINASLVTSPVSLVGHKTKLFAFHWVCSSHVITPTAPVALAAPAAQAASVAPGVSAAHSAPVAPAAPAAPEASAVPAVPIPPTAVLLKKH